MSKFERNLKLEQECIDELMDTFDFEGVLLAKKALYESDPEYYEYWKDTVISYMPIREQIMEERMKLRKDIKNIFDSLAEEGGEWEVTHNNGKKDHLYRYEIDGIYNIVAEYWDSLDDPDTNPYVLVVRANIVEFSNV